MNSSMLSQESASGAGAASSCGSGASADKRRGQEAFLAASWLARKFPSATSSQATLPTHNKGWSRSRPGITSVSCALGHTLGLLLSILLSSHAKVLASGGGSESQGGGPSVTLSMSAGSNQRSEFDDGRPDSISKTRLARANWSLLSLNLTDVSTSQRSGAPQLRVPDGSVRATASRLPRRASPKSSSLTRTCCSTSG